VDLAEVMAQAVERPPAPSTYEIDDGKEGGYSYRDMADAAGKALGRRALSVAVPRLVMAGLAEVNVLRNTLTGSREILTPGKVNEIFHRDWTVHDRRLSAALGFRPRHDLASGFRETILWYRQAGWL
jgi:nucleoside-diphosphate-sugar epimerase